MSGAMSRNKGNRGENEAKGILEHYGFEVQRMRQAGKANSGADLLAFLDAINLSVEVKRPKVAPRFFEKALRQARLSGHGKAIPVVMCRGNHAPWTVTLELSDWLRLLGLKGDM